MSPEAVLLGGIKNRTHRPRYKDVQRHQGYERQMDAGFYSTLETWHRRIFTSTVKESFHKSANVTNRRGRHLLLRGLVLVHGELLFEGLDLRRELFHLALAGRDLVEQLHVFLLWKQHQFGYCLFDLLLRIKRWRFMSGVNNSLIPAISRSRRFFAYTVVLNTHTHTHTHLQVLDFPFVVLLLHLHRGANGAPLLQLEPLQPLPRRLLLGLESSKLGHPGNHLLF